MLKTNVGQLDISVQDSTIAIQPGSVRIGNTVMEFPGGRITATEISSFGGDASSYQYSALLLQNFNGAADMTSVRSAPQSSDLDLLYPETDASKYALGLFKLWSPDGINAEIASYSKVV